MSKKKKITIKDISILLLKILLACIMGITYIPAIIMSFIIQLFIKGFTIGWLQGWRAFNDNY